MRRLDPARPYKPLDVGEAGVVATVDAHGRLLAVTQGHPVHGAVVLSAAPAFPDAARYDERAVRSYRRRLSARNAASFGLRGERPAGPAAWLLEHAIPVTALPGADAPRLATLVSHPDDTGGARGVVQIVLPGARALPLEWSGAVRLGRAEYPQLTEGGPLPPAPTRNEGAVQAGTAVLHDRLLAWSVALAGDLDDIRVGERSGRLRVQARLRAGGRVIALGLGADAAEAAAAAQTLAGLDPDDALERACSSWRARWFGWPDTHRLDAIARRGVAYALACAFPVGEAVCLVTDHRILPLAWTRDGYFIARALLAWRTREAVATVRRHLDWLFTVADRPDGWWARSHLVYGQRKDGAFQLDQQLYPLLELADYVAATNDTAALRRYEPFVPDIVSAIEKRRAPGAALFASDENPADDPLELPYQTATQILAWWTFTRLHELGVGGGRLDGLAAAVARSVADRHVIDGPGGDELYAYAVDLAGGGLLYHDANDLPLAHAAEWGFCSPSDAVWRATTRFAFSPANAGFFGGRHCGLGSLHTPGAWPLGHVQAHAIATAEADDGVRGEAERALEAAAFWDGALPEASDPDSGRPRSRAWFAWPGAAVAARLLEEKKRLQTEGSRRPDSNRGPLHYE